MLVSQRHSYALHRTVGKMNVEEDMGMNTVRQAVCHCLRKGKTSMITLLHHSKLSHHIDQLATILIRHTVHINHPRYILLVFPINEIGKLLFSHLTDTLVGNGILISVACTREDSQQKKQKSNLFHF